ncbi:MAG: prepilin-type N-terminal cleavage/methylation domain-containing protein [Planctomycetota bacterium]
MTSPLSRCRPRQRQAVATSRTSGFTLVEVVIVAAITALAIVNLHIVSKAGATAAKAGILKSAASDELNLTVDRISLALMGSSADELTGPPRAPANSTTVEYAVVLGYQDGEKILSPTESISWELGGNEHGIIEWSMADAAGGSSGGSEGGHSIVWSKSIPNAFIGEQLGNEHDDNGNGLLNEHGLAFTRDGASVDIHLTVERIGDGGEQVSLDKKHRITCRN